jgi:FkbM family methyltransferase
MRRATAEPTYKLNTRNMLNPYIAAECSRLGISQNLIETHVPETYSQAGEDIVIEALLTSIRGKARPIASIYYLEVGANHPIQTSNTYLFYRKHNAQGVLFEADPELIPALETVRPRDAVVRTAVSARRDETLVLNVSRAKELSSLDVNHLKSFAGMGEIAQVARQIVVPNTHIADVLAKYGQQQIHYLSIDVEGEDLPIMKAIDFDRYRPWVLSCEPSAQVHPDNPQQMFQVMTQAGYALVAITSVNFIFADKRWL